MTRFVAIGSAKGGVGRTTTAINLGTALANFGKDVVVLDANTSKPNVSIHLGTPKLEHTLHDVLEGRKHITDAAYIHPSGLRVIPGNISLQIAREIGELKNFRNVLLDLVGTTDMVLIDTEGGLGRDVLSVILAADELIAVTNPDVPSVTDTLKTIRIAEDAGIKVLGVIINKHSGSDFDMEIKNIEAMLDKNILGIIPDDTSVPKSIVARQPMVYLYPDTPASLAFKRIAAQMMGQDYTHSIKAGNKDFLDRLYEKI
ncbi:MAG: cell division ATPase MinD [Nanoarchaeota archaeon]|nr:cell division ATPase MinD [Nanoarchaeota archaeon]